MRARAQRHALYCAAMHRHSIYLEEELHHGKVTFGSCKMQWSCSVLVGSKNVGLGVDKQAGAAEVAARCSPVEGGVPVLVFAGDLGEAGKVSKVCLWRRRERGGEGEGREGRG